VFLPREEVARGLQLLTGRGVAMYHFFSGVMTEHYNYRTQYWDAFPEVDFRDLLRVEYVPESDHIVTALDHQRFVVEAVADWATDRWIGATAAAA
jgi:hypothetical protein